MLRALGLGDALTAVPALRGLRRAFPGRRLLLAASGEPARLLASYGVVDGVVPTSGLDGPPPGQGIGPHLAVNLHGCGPRSHRLLLAGAPGRLVAFANADAAVPGPAWDPDEHEVLRWCRLVDTAGTTCDPGEVRLAHRAPRDGPVVVHPGASTPDRRWPAPRFAAVARRLSSAGHEVVVTGSGGEARLAARVVAGAGLPSSADLSGRLDLAGLAALLDRSRLLVCGDTGVGHLATAFGTPSVLLFGPVPPTRWGPVVHPERHRVIWHGPARPGPARARPDRADPLLLDITVAEALDAALDQLTAAHPLA